ncbi:MAG: SIMPL domain-containing protein [Clostridia bacterium]|nr:SIMPL domain-containing protein [Clostridia bacterium]
MDRMITIRGIGKLSVKPDMIEVGLELRNRDMDYSAAMRAASEQQAALRDALSKAGFEPSELKTSAFNVRTEYEGVHDERGMYRQVFAGYVCEHTMAIRFGFDTDMLSTVLTAISDSIAEPGISVRFTVRDRESISDALLASAAKNALKRAELLAESSGVKLGRLISIEHTWNDPDFVSPTVYSSNAKLRCDSAVEMQVSPENMELTEYATFVWEIV